MVVCQTALRHSYQGVRAAAADALGQMGQADEATVTALLSALTDPVDQVRLAVSNALTALGQGSERQTIIRRVRAMLDQSPNAEGVLNTHLELVGGP